MFGKEVNQNVTIRLTYHRADFHEHLVYGAVDRSGRGLVKGTNRASTHMFVPNFVFDHFGRDRTRNFKHQFCVGRRFAPPHAKFRL